MEELKLTEKRKHCYACRYYNAYYTKGYKQFNREKQGYCDNRNKITANNEECENWTNNTFRKRIRKTISLTALEQMANNLSEITQIIREENE